MQLTDILELSCIKIPIQGTEKYQCITELVDLLAQNGKLDDYHTALQAVLDREAVRSTGVGQGFAIPHGKTSAVEQLVMAIGKADQAIDFDSIDGQPVTMIVLLASPTDKTGPHIQAIARISRLMMDQNLRQQLWNAASADEFYRYIEEYEEQNRV